MPESITTPSAAWVAQDGMDEELYTFGFAADLWGFDTRSAGHEEGCSVAMAPGAGSKAQSPARARAINVQDSLKDAIEPLSGNMQIMYAVGGDDAPAGTISARELRRVQVREKNRLKQAAYRAKMKVIFTTFPYC